MGRPMKDLSGLPFGRLVVHTWRRSGIHIEWHCFCDPERGGCGSWVWVRRSSLTGGDTTSCGCGRLEALAEHREEASQKGGLAAQAAGKGRRFSSETGRQHARARKHIRTKALAPTTREPSAKAKEAVRLRDEEGLSFPEIGERLGVSRQWAHQLYDEGRGLA